MSTDEYVEQLEQQLQTAKEENEKLRKANDEKNEFLQKLGINSGGEFNRIKTYIQTLTQQNKQMKDALAQIAGISRYGEYDTMTAKLQWTTVKDIAQQTLNEVNNEK